MSNPYPQQQFPQQGFPPQPQPSSGSGCWMYLLIGCLGTTLIGIVLCAGGIWWVKNNAGKLVATIAREGIVAVINESEIDAQEKTEVIAQIDRVIDAFKANKINNDELQRLFKELEDSPVLSLLQIYGIEKAYLEPSGLTAEEKQAGKRTIERVFRGIFEKKIETSELEAAMPDSMQNRAQGEKADPKARPTDEELKQFLTDLKKLADEAEIPDEDFKIDISEELKKDIDKVLVGKE